MKISLIAGGILKKGPLKELWQEYYKRLSWSTTVYEFDNYRQEIEEAKAIISKVPQDSFIIALDEKGETLSSMKFAQLIGDHHLKGTKNLVFIIGGAEGIPIVVKEKAHKSISFGSQTWPHLLVRILLIEQLYRAQQILVQHPYHRET